jgi:hypothetical protein
MQTRQIGAEEHQRQVWDMPGTMWVLAQSNDTVKKPDESFFGNGSELNGPLPRKYSSNAAQDSSQKN